MIVGSQIGPYLIERILGEGGMGVVYVGVDVRLDRRAAIKRLLPELSDHSEIVQRFFVEAKAAASINHPGIVPIYDVGWHTDQSAYFAMKLLEGDTLAKRLRAGPMPLATACTVAQQIASALAATHAAGIVHRDLKPDNIILVRDDAVKPLRERAMVLDFGIAKLIGGDWRVSHKTRTGSPMGTPLYMSPEQCLSPGKVDHRTDVYSTGCMVFEMLTGHRPFVGDSLYEVIGKLLLETPPTVRSLRPEVSRELEALVLRCLAKQPDQRYQTMAELIDALESCPPSTGPVNGAVPLQIGASPAAPPMSDPPTPLLRPRKPLEREPPERELAGRESPEREPLEREPQKREPSVRELAGREPSEREPSEREPSEREPSEREPSEREPLEREPPKCEPSEREPSEREPPKCEPPERELAGRESPEREPLECKPVEQAPVEHKHVAAVAPAGDVREVGSRGKAATLQPRARERRLFLGIIRIIGGSIVAVTVIVVVAILSPRSTVGRRSVAASSPDTAPDVPSVATSSPDAALDVPSVATSSPDATPAAAAVRPEGPAVTTVTRPEGDSGDHDQLSDKKQGFGEQHRQDAHDRTKRSDNVAVKQPGERSGPGDTRGKIAIPPSSPSPSPTAPGGDPAKGNGMNNLPPSTSTSSPQTIQTETGSGVAQGSGTSNLPPGTSTSSLQTTQTEISSSVAQGSGTSNPGTSTSLPQTTQTETGSGVAKGSGTSVPVVSNPLRKLPKKLDSGMIAGSLMTARPRVAMCSDRRSDEGRVKIQLRIDSNGDVTDIDIDPNGMGGFRTDCIKMWIWRVKFPETQEGGSLGYTFTFP